MEQKQNRNELVDSIIRGHMIWSMGAGIIPVPIIDFLAVGAIQIDMVRQISRAYDIDYKESEGKALISALTGASLARLGASAVKSIPGVGSIIGGATTAILSGASTYAIGEVFNKHFTTGGTFLDFDLASLKKFYDKKFEKGKSEAQKMHKQEKEKKPDQEPMPRIREDIVERLKELDQLKKADIITQEEFVKLKAKLLGD